MIQWTCSNTIVLKIHYRHVFMYYVYHVELLIFFYGAILVCVISHIGQRPNLFLPTWLFA